MKTIKGYGLLSRRMSDGWTQPGFYGFAVMDRGWSKTKSDSPGIIMLFMNDEVIKGFEKDRVPLAGVAGPLGEIPADQEKKIRAASIIIYAFSDGKLRGISVDDDWSTESGIGADNNLNQAIYGVKARELFTGKTPEGRQIPSAVTEYHKLLMNLPK
jgi:lipid-binding SYLF domain-containing protein